MKLNNHGWGLQVMMIFVLILMICLVIVSALINKNFKQLVKNDTSFDYISLEDKVVNASKKYITRNNIILNDNTYTITLEELQNEKLIGDIRDDYSKCSGYCVVEKKSDNVIYDAYIKCGSNYKTKNYDSNLDK